MVSPTNLSFCVLIASAMTTATAGFAASSSARAAFAAESLANANRGQTPRQRMTIRLKYSREGGDDATAEDRAATLLRSKDRVATYNAMIGADGPPAANSSSQSSTIEPDAGISNSNQRPQAGSDDDDRAGALRRLFESFGDFGNADASIPVGSSVVVNGVSLPNLGLYEWQSYELLSVYDQRVDEGTGLPTKIPRGDLKEAKMSKDVRYAVLYSERYHAECGPVLVSPDEIELVSMRDEVIDSVLMALPLFGFWTALAATFANSYNEKYGGNFLDALFRT